MGKAKEYNITMSTAPSKHKMSDEELLALKKKCVSLYIDAVIMKNAVEIGE
ncbi:hypothetical protein ACI3ER_11245 [Bacillus sp. Wb]